MREEGLEPSHPCGHRHLKPARLPIPPLARGANRLARESALLHLTFVGGASLVGSDGTCHELGSSTVIGRRGDCDIVLDGANVSRRHAQISAGSEGLLLVDLASVHGTLLNGIKVTSERLSDGDVVTIGTHQLRLELD